MRIDWAATGAMLQGWATLLGVFAVIYAARIGSNTFDAWRRQKQEERRIEAAEEILTLAYRLGHNLEAIRGPGIAGGELEAAEAALKSHPANIWNSLDTDRQSRATTAQVIRTRLMQFKEDMDEVWLHKPIALALFGARVEAPLHDLWRCHADVAAAANEYVDAGNDRDFHKQLKRTMFSYGQPDPTGEKIATAISKLEKELLPVVRANFTS